MDIFHCNRPATCAGVTLKQRVINYVIVVVYKINVPIQLWNVWVVVGAGGGGKRGGKEGVLFPNLVETVK